MAGVWSIWNPTPDNLVETSFEAEGDGTLVTLHMTLPDEATRAEMLASDMECGWRPAINDSNTVVSFGLTESGLMTAMQHEPAVSQPD